MGNICACLHHEPCEQRDLPAAVLRVRDCGAQHERDYSVLAQQIGLISCKQMSAPIHTNARAHTRTHTRPRMDAGHHAHLDIGASRQARINAGTHAQDHMHRIICTGPYTQGQCIHACTGPNAQDQCTGPNAQDQMHRANANTHAQENAPWAPLSARLYQQLLSCQFI